MKSPQIAPLSEVTGQFQGYELKDGYKIKRLQLLTTSGLQSIKLSKQAKACLFRISLEAPLTLGQPLRLQVQTKTQSGESEFKAYEVALLDDQSVGGILTPITSGSDSSFLSSNPEVAVAPTQIWVCDRSACRKRGSRQVMAALTQEICKLNLSHQIQVQTSGCLKACKQGVNVKVNGVCHQQVSPAQVAAILPKCWGPTPKLPELL